MQTKHPKVAILNIVFAVSCTVGVARAANPVINVRWITGGTPILGFDYDVITSAPASPEFPDVVLHTGRLDWRIWSEDASDRDGVGNIGVISSPASENFAIDITNPSQPYGWGARDVKAIRLIPTSTANYSNVAGGFIAGTLIDELTVQQAAGTGGEVSLSVNDVTGNMTISKVNQLNCNNLVSGSIVIDELAGDVNIGVFPGSLSVAHVTAPYSTIRIFEDVSGSLTVNEIVDSFVLFLPSGVEPSGSITFGDILGPAQMDIGSGPASQLAGTLRFLGGINDSTINILGALTGVIDLNGGGVATGGTLDLHRGGNGNVVNGGLVSGTLTLGSNGPSEPADFTGTVSLSGTAAGSSVDLWGAGTLDIAGVMDGDICGGGMYAWLPLPLTVQVGCGIGTNGTICGSSQACVGANVTSATPASGTRDARQPFPPGTSGQPVLLSERQGLGSPNQDARPEDEIMLTLDTTGLRVISHDCWNICETGTEPVDTGTPPLDPNRTVCIREPVPGGDTYQMVLERPISGENWTTIEYAGGFGTIEYASLPANANGDDYANAIDMLDLLDCLNGQMGLCPYGVYSTDLDHSGAFTVADYLTLVDLLNGAGRFVVWNGRSLPSNGCPGGSMLSSGDLLSGGAAALTGASGEADNGTVADRFIAYITGADPQGDAEADDLVTVVDTLTQWCVDQFSRQERRALSRRLSDPALEFASDLAAAAADDAAAVLAK